MLVHTLVTDLSTLYLLVQWVYQAETGLNGGRVSTEKMLRTTYDVDKSVLSGFDRLYVLQWEQEGRNKLAIVSEDTQGDAYMLLHKTEFDPSGRAAYRYVIAYIFVPKARRRRGVASSLLNAPFAQYENLAAATTSGASERLFSTSGFRREGMVHVRDDAKRLFGKKVTLCDLVKRPDLNGTMVTPLRFDVETARYECAEGLRVKRVNVL